MCNFLYHSQQVDLFPKDIYTTVSNFSFAFEMATNKTSHLFPNCI